MEPGAWSFPRRSGGQLALIAVDASVVVAALVTGEPWVSFDHQYLEAMQIEAIMPEPSSAQPGNGETTFEFAARNEGSITIRLDLKPRQAGLLEGSTLTLDPAYSVRSRSVSGEIMALESNLHYGRYDCDFHRPRADRGR